MKGHVALVLMALALAPYSANAQVRSAQSGSPFPPNGPAPRTNPSPRLNQVLPDPFAARVPNPIMRPAAPSRFRGPDGRLGPGGRIGFDARFGPDGRFPGRDGRARSNDVFRAAPWTYAPQYGRASALAGSYGFYGGYVDPGYLPYAYADTVPDSIPIRQGRLNLSVSPLSSQVFVDGLYVGTVASFQDRGLWLEPGPRRIELRADGYETVTFDVRITEDQSVEYSRDLAREAARVEPPRPPAPPKTFYVIPGCYAGDSPPQAGRLPKGCSSKNVRKIPPVVARLTPPAGTGRATPPSLP